MVTRDELFVCRTSVRFPDLASRRSSPVRNVARMKRLILLAALAATLAGTATAQAAGPPKGKYGCTIGGSQYAGDLKILSGNRYKLNKSKVGKFRVLPGKKLRFPSGIWKGLFRGRFYKTDSGVWEIALTSIDSGFESQYCDKES
jgi:hypothetical protein